MTESEKAGTKAKETTPPQNVQCLVPPAPEVKPILNTEVSRDLAKAARKECKK